MKKSLLTALPFFFMPVTLLALTPAHSTNPSIILTRPYLTAPISVSPPLFIYPADTAAPIRTILVLPSAHNTAAPTSVSTAARPPVTIRVFNDDLSGNLAGTVLNWEMVVNGIIRQKGTIAPLAIAPGHSALFRLPARMPSGNEEVFLHIRYRSRKANTPASQSRTILEDQLLLKGWSNNNLSILPAGELSFKDEDGLFTIQSPAILVQFNKQTGWLQHYEIKNIRLLEDTPGLISGFRAAPLPDTVAHSSDTTNPWQQVTPHLQLFSTSTGGELVIVRTEYTLQETSCRLHLAYTVNGAGEMQVEQSIDADSTQTGWPMPRFGMQWSLPAGLDSVTGYGRLPPGDHADSGATIGNTNATIGNSVATIDNTSPTIGIYHRLAGKYPSAYISDRYPSVRWWRITGPGGKGIGIIADSSLLNIDARHPADDSPGTQLNMDYPAAAPSYRLPYGNYRYAFKVTPLLPGP